MIRFAIPGSKYFGSAAYKWTRPSASRNIAKIQNGHINLGFAVDGSGLPP